MKNKFKAVYCTQDDCGHWYIVPLELKDQFNAYLDTDMDEDYDLQEEFEEKFGKYRTGGDLNLEQLYIKQDEESEV